MGFLGQNDAQAPQFAQSHNPLAGAAGGLSPDILAAIGGAPSPGAVPPEQPNILAAIAGGGMPAPQAAPAAEAPSGGRKRMSVLDILGGLSDAVATAGGATPMYQPSLDAATKRANDELDRGWEQKFNTQKLQTGENSLQDHTTAKFGQAARGLANVFQTAGAPGVQKALPMISQALGFNSEEAKLFGDSLQSDPQGTLEILQAATDPTASGAPPKEMTIYKMLDRMDKADGGGRAAKYIDKVATGVPDQMNPYQQQQIIDRQADNIRQDRKDNRDARMDRQRLSLDRERLDIERGKADAKAAGGADLTPTQKGTVSMKLKTIPTLEKQLARVRQLNDAMTGSSLTGFAGGRVPAALAELIGAGGIPAAYDAAVAQLQSTIRQFTRVPGEGSTSNYETALQGATLPTRELGESGRAENIAGLEQLVSGIKGGYTDLLGGSAPARPAAGSGGSRPGTVRRRLTPNSNSGGSAKRLKYNPATGRIE